MRRSPWAASIVFFLATVPVAAQSILPGSLAGWTSTSLAQFQTGHLEPVAGAAAGVLQEYGAEAAEQRKYSRGEESLTATVYRFQDASGAYGAYSFLRTPDMLAAKFSDHSSMSANLALALTGNLVLEVSGKNLTRWTREITALAIQVAPHAHPGLYPSLPHHLPLSGLVPRSDHYLVGPLALDRLLPVSSGDWLGFYTGAEAEFAQYRLEGQKMNLLIVDYPTPQVAQEHLKSLAQQFDVNPTGVQNDNRTEIFARRDATLLALVFGARSKPVADSLLGQIHSGIEITWNEPKSSLTSPNMVNVIIGTFIGTGLICAFTLAGGVIFAAFRLAVKRILPGKVFDRPSDLEVLQLGLSGKTIKTKDFY